MKKKYRYSCSTTTIWASFDCGEVDAETNEEARALALAELTENFKKANLALAHSDNTLGFTVEFNKDCIEVELIKEEAKVFWLNEVDEGSKPEIIKELATVEYGENAFSFLASLLSAVKEARQTNEISFEGEATCEGILDGKTFRSIGEDEDVRLWFLTPKNN